MALTAYEKKSIEFCKTKQKQTQYHFKNNFLDSFALREILSVFLNLKLRTWNYRIKFYVGFSQIRNYEKTKQTYRIVCETPVNRKLDFSKGGYIFTLLKEFVQFFLL